MALTCYSPFDFTSAAQWNVQYGFINFTPSGMQASTGETFVTSDPPIAFPFATAWFSTVVDFLETPNYSHRILISRNNGGTWLRYTAGEFVVVDVNDIATLGNTPVEYSTFKGFSGPDQRDIRLGIYINRVSGDPGNIAGFSFCTGTQDVTLEGEPPLNPSADIPNPDFGYTDKINDYNTSWRSENGTIHTSRIASSIRHRYELKWSAREKSEADLIEAAIKENRGKSIEVTLAPDPSVKTVMILEPVTIRETNPDVYSISATAIQTFPAA